LEVAKRIRDVLLYIYQYEKTIIKIVDGIERVKKDYSIIK